MATGARVEATGDRSIAIGGDAIGTLLVTGDNNTFFVGQYERLQDAYLDPQVLHRELNLQQFTGRGWLVAAVDAFLAREDRGYLTVEAEAGMGKTTFLAWLARERGYVTHFARLMTDPGDVGAAMRNLNAQIIRAWDLDTYAAGGILPPAAHRPEFFQEILAAAAAKRDEVRPAEPVIIVVDGLDETVPVTGQNPLGLPALLPKGVYVVTSQRTVHVPLRLEVPREVIRIEPHGAENREDIDSYLRERARDEELANRLAAAGVAPDVFVRTLLAKSQGVWVYLHYVLADVTRGRLRPDALDQLPTGLWRYYAGYWGEWQRAHTERWPLIDLPLLTTLAAVAEPLPADRIAELAGVGNTGLAEQLLDGDWRPFVEVHEAEDPVLYQPFHASLGDFLRGAARVSDLTAGERSLVRRFASASRSTHARIADRYLGAWGDMARGLPLLASDRAATVDDGYGLRHVVGHLIGADRLGDAQGLLTLDGDGHNVWFDVRRRFGDIDGYERDVAAVWAAVRVAGGPLRNAYQLRYALISTSLNSIAEATPPALWALLVAEGRQRPRAAIDHARRTPTPEERAEALTNLIPVVPPPLREETEREAIAAVRAVPDEFWRVGELWRLYPHVTGDRREALLAVVRSLVDPYFQVVAYRLLGRPELAPAMAPRIGHGFEDLESPSGVAVSAAFVDDYRRRRELASARLNSAAFLDRHNGGPAEDSTERYWAAHLLTVEATRGEPAAAAAYVGKAMELGASIGDRREATLAWSAVGDRLARTPATREWTSTDLAPTLPAVVHRVALALALGSPPQLPPGDEAAVLTELAPALAVMDATAALALLDRIQDPAARARACLAVAEVPATDPQALADAVIVVLEAHPNLPGREGMLVRAARHLDPHGVGHALVLSEQSGHALRPGVRLALEVRRRELGGVRPEDTAPTDPTWAAESRLALAAALLSRGAPAAALELATGHDHRDRRAELLGRVAMAGDPDLARTALERLGTLVAEADEVSRVAVLGRACRVVGQPVRDELFAELLSAARAITDYYNRSVALATAVGVLAMAGRVADALALSAEVTVEELRAEALADILTLPDRESIQAVAAQAASLRDQPARTLVRLAALRSALRAAAAADLVGTLFDEALADLATGPRRVLLDQFPLLIEVAVRDVPPEAARTIAEDLRAAERWWA